MKKKMTILMILILILSSINIVSAIEVKEHETGSGKIIGLITGSSEDFYPGEETDGRLIIKFIVNEWITNHWTWYMSEMPDFNLLKESFDSEPLQDFIVLCENAPYGTGYRVENFIKLIAVESDNVVALQDAGYVIVEFPLRGSYMMFIKNEMKVFDSDNQLVDCYNFLDVKTKQGLRSKKY